MQELPILLAIYEKYHPKGFEIIGVAMEEHEFTLRSFLKGSGTPWPQYFDGQRWENQLAQKYGVITLPVSYLLDGSDRIMGVNLPLPALEASLAGMVKK